MTTDPRITSLIIVFASLSLFGVGCSSRLESPRRLTVEKGCQQGGCGGELCGDADSAPLASTCDWKPEYACNKYLKTCKKQSDGTCGWNADEIERTTQCVENKEYPVSAP